MTLYDVFVRLPYHFYAAYKLGINIRYLHDMCQKLRERPLLPFHTLLSTRKQLLIRLHATFSPLAGLLYLDTQPLGLPLDATAASLAFLGMEATPLAPKKTSGYPLFRWFVQGVNMY